MKKVVSCLLVAMILLTSFLVHIYAQEDEKEISILNYNVAGLPDFSAIIGGEGRDVGVCQTAIGEFVKENNFDIFATQEDFSYHKQLIEGLGEDYNCFTEHHGGIPWGDGTNIFTKNMKLYNEAHIPFDKLYGILDDGADQFSKKGITYACIEVEDGVYIDFYNLHADAYDDEGSREAREDNFSQLAKLIKNRSVNRPIIVTGDFNAYYFDWITNSGAYDELINDCGLKDAWIELYNNGNYEDASFYASHFADNNLGEKWGIWDSVERFLYKSGDGVELDCKSYEYVRAYLEDGTSCSDHAAASGIFTYKVVDRSKISDEELEIIKPNLGLEVIRRIKTLMDALKLAFDNIDVIIKFFIDNMNGDTIYG